jgi:hypothetical protein
VNLTHTRLAIDVISAISPDVSVLELGEDEGGADDLGEQGEPAFSLETEAAQQGQIPQYRQMPK